MARNLLRTHAVQYDCYMHNPSILVMPGFMQDMFCSCEQFACCPRKINITALAVELHLGYVVYCVQAEVSNEDAEALTRQLRLRFYRTCVKDNLNVSEGSPLTRVEFVLPS